MCFNRKVIKSCETNRLVIICNPQLHNLFACPCTFVVLFDVFAFFVYFLHKIDSALATFSMSDGGLPVWIASFCEKGKYGSKTQYSGTVLHQTIATKLQSLVCLPPVPDGDTQSLRTSRTWAPGSSGQQG